MKGRLSYLRLLTENYKETYNFYANDLGFESNIGDAASDYAEFKVGDLKLSLFKREQMAKALGIEYEGGKIHECQDKGVIIFEVDNVDEEYKKLKDKGHVFLTEPMDRPEWDIRTAHLRDPEGNIIEINSRIV